MIAEIMDYAIILLDLDGTILTWNKGAQTIKGYSESDILGQNFRIFYLPRDREEKLPEKLIDLAIKEGRARHIGRRVRKDGTTFWGSILITALHELHKDIPDHFQDLRTECRSRKKFVWYDLLCDN